MQYSILFDGAVDREALRQIMAGEFAVAADRIHVGPLEERPDSDQDPILIVTPPEGTPAFGWSLMGDSELAQATGLDELQLAIRLSTRLGLRSLVDEGGTTPSEWTLVAADGTHGHVIVDEDPDTGDLRIDHALEPIVGAPELPVIPKVRWVDSPLMNPVDDSGRA